MTLKTLLATSILFLVLDIAAAQGYIVRVIYNTNLRASFSLDARIVDTAAAGVTLTVAGSHDKWLKIDRNGREMWMADWVPMTRVESEQEQGDINNCCFVDRQCNTDHEWTAGYWAYQNNQCGAPIAPVSSVSAPLTTTTSSAAEVNNCCQTGWQCHSDSDWESGFHAYQENRCLHRGLAIDGPEVIAARIHAALDLLQARAPNWYGYVVSALTKIRITPEAAYSGVYSNSGV